MAVSAPSLASAHAHVSGDSLYDKLNSKWHQPALLVFMAIVLGALGRAPGAGLPNLCDGLAAGEGGRDFRIVVSVADQIGSFALRLCVGDAYRHLGAAKRFYRNVAQMVDCCAGYSVLASL